MKNRFTLVLLVFLSVFSSPGFAADLLIGSAAIDITPDRPVALVGQAHTRISPKPETRLMAAAVAIESTERGKVLDQSILIACDLAAIHRSVLAQFRKHLQPLIPDLDMRKVIVSATHTHTAPVTSEVYDETWISYPLPKDGIMQPCEYVTFLVEQLSQVAIQAWKNRKPGGVSWTLGYATVGENRRAIYSDGHAQMYGKTNNTSFRHMEAGSDSSVEMLFFWNVEKQLKAVAINLACPSQEVEGRSAINADFWHDVREQLNRKLKVPNLTILPWCSAAGDQSPHPMVRKEAEARMIKLRGLSREQELGRRISNAVMDTLDAAKADIRFSALFAHTVEDLQLAPRKILEREYEDAKLNVAQYSAIKKPDQIVTTMLNMERGIIKRFEEADTVPAYPMELHVLRIGDIAITTNAFELFLDYGIQLKARSSAQQTFVLQLTNGCGLYLPTRKAIEGSSYSGAPHVNKVGPEGGQMLVDRTVVVIQEQWASTSLMGWFRNLSEEIHRNPPR